ncbi:MAG: alpha-glucan family phosphorylase [Hydrotalea flava]|uniref:alpha-glucan family phosphorylase n=1 Tax=Hydrotalea sp. AMD TaxID=2501297 RepID=UPI0009434088|nr:alpha-glucan family phosphorylase [Hydrotalea sp. AMD]NIM33919.1 alpha-glucan family phosphorylase [Hydrotalea flava]NIM36748.1 alpha-glucan family phosphorylase [Hydrotalea flava]NIN01934.1 alpha-glucan family phosphorylase [Hydrotalea flava]NIN13592.1 alpha-glucan family phosphorylase [Hydrotalea flava]NIO92674.1 alpha-glucan family phosphorylase [Hydrotalea flava]
MNFRSYHVPYVVSEQYNKRAAYFSMEFAIHQPLKIYSGGLGFLAGSHLRSAYELRQNMVGIGILWKYGYYDQTRNQDQTLQPTWMEKIYSFLEDTGIKFQIIIHDHPVWVKAMYLNPETFKSAPLFLLTTDLPENDYVSQTISHRLYDANVSTKIAQFMLLGIGGAKLMDELGFNPDVYHLNEAHGVSAAFYLMNKFKSAEKVKEHLVFTTHTPEEAGNEKHDIYLCQKMSYFCGISIDEVRRLTGITDDLFNHSLAALRFARKANGVSRLHGEVSRKMWSHYIGICEIIHITNAQNWRYWADKQLYKAMEEGNDLAFDDRKNYLKKRAFEIVADQTGKLFDPNVLTIVWARRFAGYKRADFLTQDLERFEKLINSFDQPVQIIWAGKPYPVDYPAISQFNNLVHLSKNYKNVAVLIGYELTLSKRLKQAADVWLNNPRVPREASGTSGMTAAMNGAVNFSTDDGWIPEFVNHGNNGFVVPKADYENLSVHDQDNYDLNKMYEILEQQIVPLYYKNFETWRQIMKNGMRDVRFQFDSNRMAHEYYELMYK